MKTLSSLSVGILSATSMWMGWCNSHAPQPPAALPAMALAETPAGLCDPSGRELTTGGSRQMLAPDLGTMPKGACFLLARSKSGTTALQKWVRH